MRTCERCGAQSNFVFPMQVIWTPRGFIDLARTTNLCSGCVKVITDEVETAKLAKAREESST